MAYDFTKQLEAAGGMNELFTDEDFNPFDAMYQGTQDFTPQILEVVRLLQEMPILQGAVLNYLREKMALIEDAKGKILYGEEKWEAMKQKLREAEGEPLP